MSKQLKLKLTNKVGLLFILVLLTACRIIDNDTKVPIEGYDKVVEIVNEIETNPNYARETKEEKNDEGKVRRRFEYIYDEKGRLLSKKESANLLRTSGRYGSGNGTSGNTLYYWYDKNGNKTHSINAFGEYRWSEWKYDKDNREIEWWRKRKDQIGQNKIVKYHENGNIKNETWNFWRGKKDIVKIQEINYAEDGRWLTEIISKKLEDKFEIDEITKVYEWNKNGDYLKLRVYDKNNNFKKEFHATRNEEGQIIKLRILDENGKIISEEKRY